MKKHFVTFYSPGTLFAEATEKPIDSWDAIKAVQMSKRIKERYGATPYGFRFTTRARGKEDLDSKVVKSSPMYYINCRVETLEEIIARNDPKENILRSNMQINGWDKVVTTVSGWKATFPFEKGDILLS